MSHMTPIEAFGVAVGLSTTARPRTDAPKRPAQVPAAPGVMLRHAAARVTAIRHHAPAGPVHRSLDRLDYAASTLAGIHPPRDDEARAILHLAEVHRALADYSRLPREFATTRAIDGQGRTAADYLAATVATHAGLVESIVETVGLSRAVHVVDASVRASGWPRTEPAPATPRTPPRAAQPQVEPYGPVVMAIAVIVLLGLIMGLIHAYTPTTTDGLHAVTYTTAWRET